MQHRISRLWKLFVRCLPVVGMLAMTARGQWNEAAWSQTNTFRNTNLWWVGVRSFTITNEVSPGVYAVTNDTFLSPIMASNYYGTNAVSGTWTERVLRWTNGTPTSFSYTVSSSVPLTQTNLTQGWRDQVNLDCYLALTERYEALPNKDRANVTNADVRFYHDPQRNLVSMKETVDWFTGFFSVLFGTQGAFYVSAPVVSNMLASGGLSRTNINRAVWGADYINYWTTSAILTVAGAAPSNYFRYTPNKYLFASNSIYTPVMTCLFTFGGPFSGTLAVTNMDCCGNTGVVVTATNYQTVAVVCTNASIASGYTSADYGFWKFRSIITNLQVIAHFAEDVSTIDTEPWLPGGTSLFISAYASVTLTNSTTNAAITDVLSKLQTNPTWATNSIAANWRYPVSSYAYVATNTATNAFATVQVGTNSWMLAWDSPFTNRVLWLASATKSDGGFGTYSEYGDLQTGLGESVNLLPYQTNMIGPTNGFVRYDIVSRVDSTNFPGSGATKGHTPNYPMWLIWPMPTTNGFKYR